MSFNFDEEKYETVTLKTDHVVEIANFITANRFSRVMVLNDESFQKIFAEKKPTLALVLNSMGRVLKNYTQLTKQYPDMNILFCNIGSSNPSRATEYFLNMVGVHAYEAPLLVYLPFTYTDRGIMNKYKTSKLTVKNMKQFIDQAVKGELETFMKSEEENDNNSIRKYTKITLNNFEEKVMKNNKYVLFGIELMHEHNSSDIKKVFKDVAKSISSLGMDDVLEAGFCDLYRNEILHKVEIQALPHVVLYDKDDKTKVHVYTGKVKDTLIRDWIQEITGLEVAGFVSDSAAADLLDTDL